MISPYKIQNLMIQNWDISLRLIAVIVHSCYVHTKANFSNLHFFRNIEQYFNIVDIAERAQIAEICFGVNVL